MAQPKSLDAYLDCEARFAESLASEHGKAYIFDSEGTAVQFRLKMNTYRERLRRQSTKIYERDDERYSTSPYDSLSVQIDKKNPKRVLIKRYSIPVLAVEDLGPED